MKRIFIFAAVSVAITIRPLFGQTDGNISVKQVPYADTLHGVVIPDPYHWMQNLNDPEVKRFIDEKNAEAEAVRKKLEPIDKELDSAMNSRKVLSSPNDTLFYQWEDNYRYYEKEKYRNLYFCRADRRGNEEILLDSRKALSKKRYKRYNVFEVKLSPDERRMAYMAATKTGDTSYIFFVRIAKSGKSNRFDEQLDGALDFAWLNDTTLIYTKNEGRRRTYKVFSHILGYPQQTDKLVYAEDGDNDFEVSIKKSTSGKYVFVMAESFLFCDYRYVRADGSTKLIVARSPEHRPIVDHYGNDTVFHILTNQGASNGQVLAASIRHPEIQKVLVPEMKRRLRAIHDAGKFLLVEDCENEERYGFTVVDKATGQQTPITFDEAFYKLELLAYDATMQTLRFKYFSYLTPTVIYDYSLNTNQLTKVFQEEVTNYRRDDYVADVLYAPSRDSMKIPFMIFYRKDLKRDGSAPAIMGVYGNFGEESITFPFTTFIPAMLDFGFVMVFPSLRGEGGEFSNRHKAGTGMHKMNVAYDTEAVIRYLIDHHFTSKGKVNIAGASGGALTVGMLLNWWPDYFATMVFNVSALDALQLNSKFMSYEFGDLKDPEQFAYIMKWSPYQNVKPGNYPALLFTASEKDINVNCWETVKMVAKLQANRTNDKPLLMQIDKNGDHNYSSPDFKHINQFTFLIALARSLL